MNQRFPWLALALIAAIAVTVSAVVLEGGVVVETTLKPEAGADCAVEGDTVVVHYTGRLTNAQGKIFDTSKKHTQPFEFTLGEGRVIPAWEVAIEGMCVGEIRTLVTPPSMAYGDRGYPPVIPPKATLFFEVELFSIIPGPNHTPTTSSSKALILVPLLLVIAGICYFGYKIISSPDKGKIAKKGKKQ